MAQSGMSNADRRRMRKTMPAKPRAPKAEAAARTVRVAKPEAPAKEDGLLWLVKKGWLTRPQGLKGLHYRDLVRAAPDGSIKVVDLCGAGGGGAVGGGLPFGGSFGDGQAALDLYVIRQLLLQGEPDLLLVMEGVCARGHTPRELAGGNQYRAHELISALRIALNMMIASDAAKVEALGRAKHPSKAA